MTLALLRNPDELARLRADESLMALAVEEGLRYEGPPVWVPRFALDGLSVDGIEMEPGTQMALFLASANRDEEMFEDPELVPHQGAREGPSRLRGGQQVLPRSQPGAR